MATVSGADYDVYLGFWTNWSQGKGNGATLTLTRKDGDLLISFVAIFVALSGKSFWRICCFIVHRSLSTINPQDGLYHQRQAILRNANTPEDGAWRTIQALFAWKKNARRPYLRLLPLAMLAICTFAALLVGGIFSSRLTSDNGSEVLLTGKLCGPTTDLSKVSTTFAAQYRSPQIARRAVAYSNYALQCHPNATGKDDCRLYTKPWIASKIDRNATCPFDDSMCKSKFGNIIVDSGLIDSHHDLGINRPKDERFQMRFVEHCAPLVTEGHNTVFERPGHVPVAQYWYGNLTLGESKENYTGFTYEVMNNYSNLDLPASNAAAIPRPEYALGHVEQAPDTKYKSAWTFDPIPQLSRDDADTTILFLSSQGIEFSSRVDDPWFSATTPSMSQYESTLNVGSKSKDPLYRADEPASPLGCASQVQWCNPNLPKDRSCEPLHILQTYTHNEEIWNEKQIQAIDWASAMCPQELFMPAVFVTSIGTSILLARQHNPATVSGPLPNNQWQIEIEHLMAASLASLQGTIVEATNGARTEELKQLRRLPDTDIAKKMCANQKIRSSLYASFAALPLAILLILGTCLILLDISLEPALNAYHNRRAKKLPRAVFTRSTHSKLEWRAMSFLQLQRMAHQGIGSGTWLRTTSDNPITIPYEKLGMLDIRDQDVPQLTTVTDDLSRWYTEGDDVKCENANQGNNQTTSTENQSSSNEEPVRRSAEEPARRTVEETPRHSTEEEVGYSEESTKRPTKEHQNESVQEMQVADEGEMRPTELPSPQSMDAFETQFDEERRLA